MAIARDGAGNWLLLGILDQPRDLGLGELPVGGFLLKMTADGEPLHQVSMAGAYASPSSMVLDEAAGVVHVGGFVTGPSLTVDGALVIGPGAQGTTGFVLTFTLEEGFLIGTRVLGSEATTSAYVTSVAMTPSGGVIARADVSGTVDFGAGPVSFPQQGSLVISLGADLAYEAHRFLPVPGLRKLAVHSQGHVLLAGQFAGGPYDLGIAMVSTPGDADALLVRLEPDLTVGAAWPFVGEGAQAIDAIAVDAQDRIVLTGSTQAPLDFGGGPVPPGGFLHRLLADGEHESSATVVESSALFIGALSIGADGVIALGGFAGGASIDLGSGPIPIEAGLDGFVARYEDDLTPLDGFTLGGSAGTDSEVRHLTQVDGLLGVAGWATGPMSIPGHGSFTADGTQSAPFFATVPTPIPSRAARD